MFFCIFQALFPYGWELFFSRRAKMAKNTALLWGKCRQGIIPYIYLACYPITEAE
jgi:hypothetical protein